jgi:nitrous oxidase accessory protein
MIRYWLVIGLCMGELTWMSAGLAGVIQVIPGDNTLQAAIDSSAAGDRLELSAGIYSGPVTISHSLSIIGSRSSVLDGKGTGNVVYIDAPEVVIRGIRIRNSGNSLEDEDSGVFVTSRGDKALIEGCFFEDNLIGIYLKGPDDAVVKGNVIVGSQYFRMNDRGNGVYLWNTPGSRVEDNDIRFGRDGIFVTTSHHNAFINNNFSDLRFAIHYMYTHDSNIIGNHSTRNHSAFALMFSNRLTVIGNESSGDRDRGLFLNFVNTSTMQSNRVSGVEKCVFIYNANMNTFTDNRFQGCDIGIHFTAGSEKNEIFNNSFVGNRTQVKYVGTRSIEWSHQGRGNYWSDNTAFDLNDDGIADRVYKPNSLVDQLVWKYPLARLLLGSPVMQMLHWVQSEFPTLHPGGVSDSAPLMQPPAGV